MVITGKEPYTYQQGHVYGSMALIFISNYLSIFFSFCALNTNLKNKITGQSNNIVIYGGTWVLHGVSNQIYTNKIDISNLGLSSVISVIAQPENYPSLIHVAVSIVSAKLLNVQTFKDTTGDFAAHFIIIGTK